MAPTGIDYVVTNYGGGGGGGSTSLTTPNCSTKRGGYSGKWAQRSCVLGEMLKTKHVIAYSKVVYAIVTSAAIIKAENLVYKRLVGVDDSEDAKRHIYWSALLCKYYNTLIFSGSKLHRMDFAKAVGDFNESCGVNNVDASEMDEHNNAIGRQMFADNTGYKYFWWITVGLILPSNAKLRTEAVILVNRSEKVKDGGKVNNDKICYRKNQIRYHMDKKKPVVLKY